MEDFAAGRPLSCHASSLEIQQAATRAGAGIAALPDSMAGSDTELVPVLRETPLLSRDIWLVVHRDLKRSGSVRVVVWAIQGA